MTSSSVRVGPAAAGWTDARTRPAARRSTSCTRPAISTTRPGRSCVATSTEADAVEFVLARRALRDAGDVPADAAHRAGPASMTRRACRAGGTGCRREEVVVRRNARRMLAAMAEAMAEHGYVGTPVAEILKRAGCVARDVLPAVLVQAGLLPRRARGHGRASGRQPMRMRRSRDRQRRSSASTRMLARYLDALAAESGRCAPVPHRELRRRSGRAGPPRRAARSNSSTGWPRSSVCEPAPRTLRLRGAHLGHRGHRDGHDASCCWRPGAAWSRAPRATRRTRWSTPLAAR